MKETPGGFLKTLQPLLRLQSARLDVLVIGLDEAWHLHANQQPQGEQGQPQVTSQHVSTCPRATHSPRRHKVHSPG